MGPATSCVRDMGASAPLLRRNPIFLPAYERSYAFGTMMFMAHGSYTPIPDNLLVWRGDDYLFRRQVARNYMMLGIDVATHMSTTSSDPAFDSIKDADMTAFEQHYGHDPYRLRYWKEFRASKTLRSSWERARRCVSRDQEVRDV